MEVIQNQTATAWIFVAFLGISGLLALYQLALPRPFPGIPYNAASANRIMGDLPEFEKRQKRGLTAKSLWSSIASEAGSPIAQSFMLPFTRPWIIIADYGEVKDLLLRRARDLGRGSINNQVWSGLVPEHFIAMEEHDARYRAVRSLVQDLMTPKFIHGVSAPASYYVASEFIDMWKAKAVAANGRPFDADHDLGFLTFSVIHAAAFGESRGDSTDFVKEAQSLSLATTGGPIAAFASMQHPRLLTAMDIIGSAASECYKQPFRRLFHFFNNARPDVRGAFQTRTAVIKPYIQASLDKMAVEGDSFEPVSGIDHILVRERRAAGATSREAVYDSPTIINSVFGYLLGGQDSTHSTLCFLVKHLASEQVAQRKLRDALQKAYPVALANRDNPSLNEILKSSVPYLDAFIQEVLRISNPIAFVAKETIRDMEILGHRIPAGTTLMLSTSGPTMTQKGVRVDQKRRSATYKENEAVMDWGESDFAPNEFHADRWLRIDPATGAEVFDSAAGPFLSFSNGPRTCWGKRLALMELKLIVTLLVWNFEFREIPEGLRDNTVLDGLFMKPLTCYVQLEQVFQNN